VALQKAATEEKAKNVAEEHAKQEEVSKIRAQ